MHQTDDLTTQLISLDDVADAAIGLRGIALRTPVLENPDVNRKLGGRLLVKAENMQRTGAFKLRGAYNCIRQFTAQDKARGVVTYSSGNHALGVALAANMLGTSSLIVMPSDVPIAKRDAVSELGCQIATFDRDSENSDDVVERLRVETGRLVVPPSADARVLAGAGTAALEFHEQAASLGATLDALLVPCGGGGLTAASAVVMNALSIWTSVYAVEPVLFDDTRRSLEAGERVANPPGRRTICDAIMTPIPNTVTFPINRRLLTGGLVASDEEVRDAMRFAYEHFKIVVEPGAGVGLAAVLSGRLDITGKVVGVFVTGGNVDIARFFGLVARD